MTKNIVLIGMMGCGKTTCGSLLARRLGRPFFDTDDLIEAREGRAVAAIFAREGENYFREKERQTAEELSRREGLVIACGGGLPLREESIAPLKESGTVIFLRRDPGETYDKLNTAGRPLAQQGREAFLERFARREPVYRRWADRMVASCPTPEETVNAILEVLK